jgi:O-antigen/teichoic acid export membrane protein
LNNILTRNIVRTFSTQVGCQVLSILSGIVIARVIGPVGKGFLSYAVTAVSLVSVFFNGFGDAVLYQFGRQKRAAHAVHDSAIRIFLVVLAIVVPFFVAIAVAVPSQRPLAAAAAVLPFAIYVQVMTPFLMVRDNILLVNMRTIVQSLGTAVLTIPLLVIAHLGLSAAVSVWVFFYVVAAIHTALGVWPILRFAPPADEMQGDTMGGQIRFGLRAAGASVAGLLNLRIDIFVVSIMFAPALLGCYTLAIASGELLWQVSRAFVWSALGRIGSDPFAESAALVARVTRNTLAIVASLAVIAFLAGPWLIEHIYGQRFAPAGSALRWALPGLVAYAAEAALNEFIILQLGRPVMMMWIQCASTIVCAGSTFAAAGHFGIVAAAASTSLTYLLVTAIVTTMFVRATGISIPRLLLVQRDDLEDYLRLLEGMLRSLKLRSA